MIDWEIGCELLDEYVLRVMDRVVFLGGLIVRSLVFLGLISMLFMERNCLGEFVYFVDW